MYSEIEIKISEPVVRLCETVIDTSSIKCFATTQNKQNKLSMLASSLDVGLDKDIEREFIRINDDPKVL